MILDLADVSFFRLACFVVLLVSPLATGAVAQNGQWLTFGHDPQRTGWAHDEHAFTRANVRGLRLVWRTLLPNAPRSLAGLDAPVVVRSVTGSDGRRRALVIVAGSSDLVFALDAADGSLVWRRHFESREKASNPPGWPDWWCPNNLNDTPVIDPARGRLFLVSADGQVYTLGLADGHDLQAPVRFVLPYTRVWSLNYDHGVLYTTSSNYCHYFPNGVFALNPDEPGHPRAVFWTDDGKDGGGGIWGRGGPVADFEGYILASAGDAPFDPAANEFGDSLLRLAPASLHLAGYNTPGDWSILTQHDLDPSSASPVVFHWHQRVLVAWGGKSGVVYLNDESKLNSPDHHRAAFASPRYGNDTESWQGMGIWGGLSTWRDHGGRRWLYVPVWGPPSIETRNNFAHTYGSAPHGSVLGFVVVEDNSGQPRLKPIWRSGDINVPDPVAISGGVVFVLGTGENTIQTRNNKMSGLIHNRLALSADHATLYALDAYTGQQLWDSGNTISDWVHFSGLAVAAGRIFCVTHGGGVYAFGLDGATELPPWRLIPGPNPPPPPRVRPQAGGPSSSVYAPRTSPGCSEAWVMYESHCSICHGKSGKGYPAIGTPNFGNPTWQVTHDNPQIVDAIAHGKAKEGARRMPAFGGQLTQQQIERLVNCVIRDFGRQEPSSK